MSSYNDNLRETVVASLQSQELDLKQEFSQLNAAMFALFYANGATITAEEKLFIAANDLTDKQIIKKLSVESSNVSKSLLMAASRADSFVKLSQTNGAVSAANVQVAASSIVRLAGDIGGIYSILNAADLGASMYEEAEVAYNLINATAKSAEEASDIAMESSSYIAEVTSSAALDKSKNTNSGLTRMLAIASSDYMTALQQVNTDDDLRATTRAAENTSESNFNDLAVEYSAASKAYNLMNNELNLSLTATIVNNDMATEKNATLTISFERIKNPFYQDSTVEDFTNSLSVPLPDAATAKLLNVNKKSGEQPNPTLKSTETIPVSAYVIFFVKDEKKYTFSLETAEMIRQNDPKVESDDSIPYVLPYWTSDAPAGNLPAGVLHKAKQIAGGKIFCSITDILNVAGNYLDSDGDNLQAGKKYVVFVMATFTDKYKRMINDFTEFLSAASPNFVIAESLPVAKSVLMDADRVTFSGVASVLAPQAAVQGAGKEFKVNYRVLFLPLMPTTDQNIGGISMVPIPDQYIIKELTTENNLNGDMKNLLPFIDDLPFVYNVAVAQEVAAGNYLVTHLKRDSTPESQSTTVSDAPTLSHFTSKIIDSTTDVFGNLLQSGMSYKIVVLSICDSPVLVSNSPFYNNLSTAITGVYIKPNNKN